MPNPETEKLVGGGREESGSPPSHADAASKWEEKHGPHGSKLTLLPLVALIFYEVSGGPFGLEDTVKFGGPLPAILGFLFFPLIWSLQEALLTAELATAFPENGGYVVWISAAFGPFWGFQEGWWKWLSGVIDNSLYPILFLDYLKRELPVFESGIPRVTALIVITVLLTYLNYRGLTIVGAAAVGLTVFSLLPFLVMSVISIPQIKPSRWLQTRPGKIHWRGYLNTLFWNLNCWDSVSTLAGEVHQPRRTFPRALLLSMLLVVLCYLLPLLAGTGALPYSPDQWEDGYFSTAARAIGGPWLGWWVTAAAALSNLGLFEAEMSSDAFQLLGMADRGMLPEVFALRSVHGTPLLGILCSASGVLLLSWMSFQEIVEFLNFLYCVGMLFEFAAFIWLRISQPDLERPYAVPLGTVGVSLMCVPPTAVLLFVMCIASWKTIIVSFSASAIGLVAYPALMFAKHHHWFKFTVDPSLPEVVHMEELEEDTDWEEKEVAEGGESLSDTLLEQEGKQEWGDSSISAAAHPPIPSPLSEDAALVRDSSSRGIEEQQ